MYMPIITDELASDLSLLSLLPSDEEVKEFCKMSTQIILQKQTNKNQSTTFISRKVLEKAAAKLKVSQFHQPF
jgi:hypothetical protein